MFCVKCGKEIPNDSKVCMYCGAKLTKDNPSSIQTLEKQPKKKKRKIVLIIAFVIVLVILGGAIFSDGNEDSTSGKITSDKTQAPVSLEEVGGVEVWKENGYKQAVRTDVCVKLPIEARDNNNYAVTIGALGTNIVVIMQEDESPVNEWEWLMNAEPFEEGGDEAFFKATLFYTGKDTEEGYPVFVVNDIESY